MAAHYVTVRDDEGIVRAALNAEALACSKHPSCANLRQQVANRYETLSTYDPAELDDEQREFLATVDELSR